MALRLSRSSERRNVLMPSEDVIVLLFILCKRTTGLKEREKKRKMEKERKREKESEEGKRIELGSLVKVRKRKKEKRKYDAQSDKRANAQNGGRTVQGKAK